MVSLWSAAAWRRFRLDHLRSIAKRRQAAALQGETVYSKSSETRIIDRLV